MAGVGQERVRWRWRRLALAALAALACLGCSPRRYDETRPEEVASAADLADQAAAERTAAKQRLGLAEDLSSQADPIPPLLQQPAAAVADFTWTERPTLAAVPPTMVTGRLAGRDFIAQYASVAVGDEAGQPVLRLRLSNQPAGDIPGFSLDDDAVLLQWANPLGPGELSHVFGATRPSTLDAWFVIEQKDGVPLTRSAPFACILKIQALKGPTTPGGAPSLEGQLAICFNDEHQSWVAGTFAANGLR